MTCGGMFANKAKFVDHVVRQNSSGCKWFFIKVFHFMHSLDFNGIFAIYFIVDESFQCSHCLKHCGSERILRDHMRHHGMLQMVVLYMYSMMALTNVLLSIALGNLSRMFV